MYKRYWKNDPLKEKKIANPLLILSSIGKKERNKYEYTDRSRFL